MCRIELKKCSYVYQPGSVNQHEAIKGIDLCIADGEMVAVIGRGGSGKSTLALVLAGLYTPTSGTLLVDGRPVSPEKIFTQVGLVFQYPEQQLFADSVYDEIAFGLRNFGVPEEHIKQKVENALLTVGLDPAVYAQRSPLALSGGQKRRVAIGCMLAISPQTFIFDEPAAGLDSAGRLWIRQLLCQLNASGHTVIWVSHDMAEVAETARRVIIMDRGHIIADGKPLDVFSRQDALDAAGLAPSPAAHLVRELKERGADIPGIAVTADGAFAEIAAYLEDKAHV